MLFSKIATLSGEPYRQGTDPADNSLRSGSAVQNSAQFSGNSYHLIRLDIILHFPWRLVFNKLVQLLRHLGSNRPIRQTVVYRFARVRGSHARCAGVYPVDHLGKRCQIKGIIRGIMCCSAP